MGSEQAEPAKKEQEEKPKTVPLSELFRYRSKSDKVLFGVGLFASVLTGLAMPSFVILLGEVTNSFDPTSSASDTLEEIEFISMIFAIVSVAIWVITYVYFAFFAIISENTGFEFRSHYLHAILKQEIEWFDSQNPQELPSRISKECMSI